MKFELASVMHAAGARFTSVMWPGIRANCPDLITSYTQIGGDHLGNKSDEIQTKSIRRKLQAASR
jgi:hypothetical protein